MNGKYASQYFDARGIAPLGFGGARAFPFARRDSTLSCPIGKMKGS